MYEYRARTKNVRGDVPSGRELVSAVGVSLEQLASDVGVQLLVQWLHFRPESRAVRLEVRILVPRAPVVAVVVVAWQRDYQKYSLFRAVMT